MIDIEIAYIYRKVINLLLFGIGVYGIFMADKAKKVNGFGMKKIIFFLVIPFAKASQESTIEQQVIAKKLNIIPKAIIFTFLLNELIHFWIFYGK